MPHFEAVHSTTSATSPTPLKILNKIRLVRDERLLLLLLSPMPSACFFKADGNAWSTRSIGILLHARQNVVVKIECNADARMAQSSLATFG